MPNRSGKKSASQTKAPLKDRIVGSKVNPKGSASSEQSASVIKLNAKTIATLVSKLKEFKETHNTNKVSLNDLKAVYRRGLGAYSTSHRPNIPRNAWAMARVNAFLRKAGGGEHKKAYVQDDDLLKMHLGGDMSKHLAPNGKPSNLTHEQWHLVRTPEFKAWFGDWENDSENSSKVVDENGEPLVVYHGTRETFYEFKNRLFGYTGFYFTDNISVVRTYGSKIRKFFLNSKDFNRVDMKGGSYFGNADLVDDLIQDAQVYYKDVHLLNYVDPLDPESTKNVKPSNIFVMFDNKNIKLADGSNTTFDSSNPDIRYADGGNVGQDIKCRRCGWEWNTKDSEEFDKYVCHKCNFDNRMYYDKNPIGFKDGGEVDAHKETYAKWKSLVNMSKSELERFYNSEEGKKAGLTPSQAKAQGIDSGRESARWVMKMKDTNVSDWTPMMWKWANKQISFISRMSGNKGGLYDDKGNKTRKHLSLLIWGNNPEKKNNGGLTDKYENGAEIYSNTEKLIKEIKKHSEIVKGVESIAKDGQKYRYDKYILKYNSASYWLVNLFDKSAEENGKKNGTQFSYDEKYSFYFDRPKFKGSPNGKITMSELVEGYAEGGVLSNDLQQLLDEYRFKFINKEGNQYSWKKSLKHDDTFLVINFDENVYALDNKEGNYSLPNLKKLFKSERLMQKSFADGGVTYGLPMNLTYIYNSRNLIPDVRGGWTKEKIVKYFKNHSSDTISTFRLTKYISEFDNWEQLKNHIYYHGTQNYIERGMKPSMTMSEREAERIGGGGYGQRYYGISLTKRKRTAESFSGMSSGVTIYPIILKRDAKVIERTDLQDASDVEDIIVELYEQGVDAVWIGGGEEELVVVNPYSILLYKDGREYHSVYGGFKSVPLTDEKIKEMYDTSKILLQEYSEGYKIKENFEEKKEFLKSLPKIQFENGGTINQPINQNIMEQVKFNQLPHIDTINNGDKILITESVFHGNLDNPKHKGERYIHCEVMGKGGMLNSLNLKVLNSVGANALSMGQTITRPIANVLSKGRKMGGDMLPKFKDGGLNPDSKNVKNYFAHDMGNAGGVLVGNRHSEGGIKAINKGTGQPLEMEGGEVVITRGAVSNPKKYEFDGKEMTTREVLSKLNVDGGGVSFAEGGDVPEKMKCGCSMKYGGKTMKTQDFVDMSEKEYQQYRLEKGIEKEKKDHYDILSKLNSGAITIQDALKEIAQKEMKIDAKYPFEK